jgi:hypothetical protein
MAKSETKGDGGRDPLQIRLSPRIHDLITKRKNDRGTTMKAEIEELISKGEQLEQLLAPKGRLALDVVVALLGDGGPSLALKRLLEGGADHRVLQGAIDTWRIEAGIAPTPKFPGDAQ